MVGWGRREYINRNLYGGKENIFGISDSEGLDGVIDHIQNEINFSQQYTPRIRVIIGQETSNEEPKKITFFGKSFNAMVEEVKKTSLKFEDSPNVAGFSFNNADSFLEMEW